MDKFDFNPLDATKDWFEEDIPYQHVGSMSLTKNPDDIFAETEQVGFNPGVFVPGIEASEDKLLQGRLFSYSDTQRYRVGPNYLQLPINCPFAKVDNYQQNGFMSQHKQNSSINYEPNRYQQEPKEDLTYTDHQKPIQGVTGRQVIEKTNDFGQAGQVYRRFSSQEQEALVKNLTNDLEDVAEETWSSFQNNNPDNS